MRTVRRIITLATAGACTLAVASSTQAATVTAVPADMGAVVTGHHPEATVTFKADPGMAFARDGSFVPLESDNLFDWELVSTDCNGPLSQPSAPVTSCTALVRVLTDVPGENLGTTPMLHFHAVEFDLAGVEPSTVVQRDATVGGGITYPSARATKGASVTPSFFHQSGTAVFRIAYNLGMTGHVKVVSVRTGEVVRTFAASGFAWTVRWHGRDGHGHLVAPGRYRMQAVASVRRPFIAKLDTLRSRWVTTVETPSAISRRRGYRRFT
jgi:hypothetical protein